MTLNRSFIQIRVPLILVVLGAAAPWACAQHSGDIVPYIAGNRIATGQVDPGSSSLIPDVRFFAAELGELAPNVTDEPGFDALPGTFPIPSGVGFEIMDSLRKWNGVNFSTIPAERMGISILTLGPVLTPITPSIVDGLTLNVAADGSWHRHFDFTLTSPASTGVYLLQLRLFSTSDSIEKSRPFYLVFNQNDTEEHHDEALAYAEANLPEPSSWILAVSGLATCAGGVWRRFRRS